MPSSKSEQEAQPAVIKSYRVLLEILLYPPPTTHTHTHTQSHAVPWSMELTWCWHLSSWTDAVGNERGLEGDFGMIWSPFYRWQNKRYGYFCKTKFFNMYWRLITYKLSQQSFGGGGQRWTNPDPCHQEKCGSLGEKRVIIYIYIYIKLYIYVII